MGVYQIGFTGGEPMVRKDIFEILEYANRKGLYIALLTNGYLIDAKTADKLKKVNVDKIDITLNSLDPDTFTGLSGVRGSCEKVRKAIDLLLERGMQVKIKSSGTCLNRDEIVDISKFAREKNIPYLIDGEILPCRDGYSAWVDKFSLDAETLYDIRKQVYPEMFAPCKNGKKRKRSRTKRRRDKVFTCGVGMASFSINPYGKMNFCLEIDYPKCDILKDGAVACWEKMKKEIDKIEKRVSEGDFICRDCNLLPYCGWCAGRSYIETGSFNRCSEYFKKRATINKRLRNR